MSARALPANLACEDCASLPRSVCEFCAACRSDAVFCLFCDERCHYCARVAIACAGLSYAYDEGSLAYRVACDHVTAPLEAQRARAVALATVLARVVRRAARAAWRRAWRARAAGELFGRMEAGR